MKKTVIVFLFLAVAVLAFAKPPKASQEVTLVSSGEKCTVYKTSTKMYVAKFLKIKMLTAHQTMFVKEKQAEDDVRLGYYYIVYYDTKPSDWVVIHYTKDCIIYYCKNFLEGLPEYIPPILE